jgi:hypothetical protein
MRRRLEPFENWRTRVKSGPIILAVIAVAALDAGSAFAGSKSRSPVVRPVREPCSLSWTELFWPSCSVGPYATGAAPAAYVGRSFAGQDPDPRIRHQLQREFGTDRW